MSRGILVRTEELVAAMARRLTWLPLGLVLTGAVFCGVEAYRFGHNFAAGSDATGYLFNAQMILAGELLYEPRPVAGLPLEAFAPLVYQPHGMTADLAEAKLIPTYPFGYPLLLALVEAVSGAPMERALRWALVLVAVAAPWLTYALARELGSTPFWSMVAGGLIGISPLTRHMALEPMSDLWSLELACVVMIAAIRVRVGGGPGWHVLLGLAWAWALHTRLTNGLMVVPVAIVLWGAERRSWQGWWIAALGMLGGIVSMGWINLRLYGSPWSTGYTEMEELFSAAFVWPTVKHVGRWLGPLLSPMMVVGFGLTLVRFRRRRDWVPMAMWGWFGSLAGFYCFYRFTHETWWYTRFILPALPAAAIGSCWMWQTIEQKLRPILSVLLRALVVGWGVQSSVGWAQDLLTFPKPAESPYVWLDHWMQEHMRPADLLVCDIVSESVYFNRPNPIVRYFGLNSRSWARLRAAAAERDLPIYCAVFRLEIEDWRAFDAHLPGDWTPVATYGDLEVYRLDADASPEIPRMRPSQPH